ncbi:MAG: 50S ribosomal protein L17 [Spirochaetales bacterium]|nr:50S ribosomal protein L17 [Spirochaetales bacterium]
MGYNKLNRVSAHRKALIKNMMTVLFKHERIVTTKAKAIEVRRNAEKLITRAKEDTVHNRRLVERKIRDEAILAKLFKDIAPRFKERTGGYTRILKIGFRKQDAADMVVLELVDYKLDTDKKAKKGDKPAKAEKPVAEKKPVAKKAAEAKKPAAEKKAAEAKKPAAEKKAKAPAKPKADAAAEPKAE